MLICCVAFPGDVTGSWVSVELGDVSEFVAVVLLVVGARVVVVAKFADSVEECKVDGAMGFKGVGAYQ